SEQGNEAGLQLRWAIGRVLHTATPADVPQVYLDFAGQLTKTDRVLTLNYDLLLERALDAVAVPYRRFPTRFSEGYDTHAVVDPDQPDEVVINKLHGSIDWTVFTGREDDLDATLRPVVEGPRPDNDALQRIAVIPPDRLDKYYSARRGWWAHPLLLFPP